MVAWGWWAKTLMGWLAERAGGEPGARMGALLIVALVLAQCSAADKVATSPRYSPKMVEDSEPVPKGGGRYSVGRSYSINGRTYTPVENAAYRAEGVASWYGPDFHGRQTANGEIYDMHSISAAHPTMPLPSYARVTNLDNGRSIIVRVNDRGPYAHNRILDVSISAAQALDFHRPGLANVRVEYVGRAPLEGSDDRMLTATLRHGSPAPAPSRVMIASTTPLLPFIPRNIEARGREGGDVETPPLPTGRPFSLGLPESRTPERTPKPDIAPVRSIPGRSGVKLPDASEPIKVPVLAARRMAAPPQAFLPMRNDGGVGLMSGRGLY